jgi:GT2 family glycosyltransferase
MVTPAISVIVPTSNRPVELVACLEALGRQTFPAEAFEVVVVDDGSADGCLVSDAVASAGGSARVVRQERSGPATARNLGAAVARADWLAFTDDDCRPEPGWLASFAAVAERHLDCALGGRTLNLLVGNRYSEASQCLIGFLYRYYNQDAEHARFFTSNNMMLPRRTFQELGGFDPSFTRAAAEDRDLCDRWRRSGRRMVYVPEARVGHAHALTLLTFLHQHLSYGRGAALFHKRRAERADVALRVEPLRFYLDVVAEPFHSAPIAAALPTSVLLACAQAANAVGFLLPTRQSPHATTVASAADRPSAR